MLGNAFGVVASNEEELISTSVHILRAGYQAWIVKYRKEHPGEQRNCTEVPNISPKTLGVKGQYQLKTKAMMTRPLVPFTIYLLAKFKDKIPNQLAVQAAGQALENLLVTFRVEGHIATSAAHQAWSKSVFQVFTS